MRMVAGPVYPSAHETVQFSPVVRPEHPTTFRSAPGGTPSWHTFGVQLGGVPSKPPEAKQVYPWALPVMVQPSAQSTTQVSPVTFPWHVLL